MTFKVLENITVPLCFLLMGCLGWFVNRLDSRIYEIQTNYVSHAQLAESIRSIERVIQQQSANEAALKKSEGATFMAWLDRIETNQAALTADVKQLMREIHNGK